MTSMLCLAHYCDTHGPTPLMVTEGLPVACLMCCDEDTNLYRPDTGNRTLKPSDGLVNTSRVARAASSSSDKDIDLQRALHTRVPSFSAGSSSTLDTPPESPRLAALQVARQSHRRDSSFRKTYDENDRKRAIPCENCALTLPKKVKEQALESTPSSPSKSEKTDNNSPVLRTRKPYERVSSTVEERSPKSTPSDSDEAERISTGHSRRRSVGLKRSTTSSTISSFSSSNSTSHNHYIDYTSTHDPLSSTSFSVLRASCLRTLSCETLPPTSTSVSPTTPTSPSIYGPAKASTLATGSTSGGPIFFGDPLAGYTTAYIFRIPDPYARGHRRVYAFICLSTARERAAMRAFSYLAAAFRDLASWIQGLAEAEADRTEADSESSIAPRSQSQPHTPSVVRSPTFPDVRGSRDAYDGRDDGMEKGKARERKTSFTPTSSFLSGRQPVSAEGFARKGLLIRSRGLAELVGRADFFIELHARFVALLAQLAALFSN